MATTGPALWPATTQFPNTNVYPGQGNLPLLRVLYSTEDAKDTDPLWIDATAKVRGPWSSSRGRETELEDVNAGTATITLDNRTRVFDPLHNTAIRPMNRWKIYEEFSGETQAIFTGYADSYEQQWPSPVGDALTVVACTDEFKVLSRDRLPTMNPPRDTYADLVQFDQPTGYYQYQTSDALQATVGPNLDVGGGYSWSSGATVSPIVGDPGTDFVVRNAAGILQLSAGNSVFSTPFTQDPEPWNAAGLNAFTVETWFKTQDATPSSAWQFMLGKEIGGIRQWLFQLNANGTVAFQVRSSGGVTYTATSALALQDSTWYHLVGQVEDTGSINVYINGSASGTAAWTGPVLGGAASGDNWMTIQNAGAVTAMYDESAYYPVSLPSARIFAHYQAGALRGFPANQVEGTRITAILDAVDSQAQRRIDSGSRQMSARFQTGDDPLQEIRKAADVSGPDGIFFAARDGTLVFLDHDHRSSSPYSTVQATFDDDGTDLPYAKDGLTMDYGEAFLFNEWNVTTYRGQLTNVSDPTSIARYFKRSQSVTDLLARTTADAATIAAAMLAKYKDPLTRITSITLTTAEPAVAEAVFRRDIGDRIRVFRTPPGGGSRIDQTLFIQKIQVDGSNDGKPWTVRWSVSPV